VLEKGSLQYNGVTANRAYLVSYLWHCVRIPLWATSNYDMEKNRFPEELI
jgi:hypothetical protein